MLKAHFEAVENSLLASARIAANTGHSLHKGTPREAFVRDFLGCHLSEKVAIGSGEIIDSDSEPNPPSTAQRPQHDIVIYKRDYPRLNIGGGIHAFLAESVVATIEVKSTLDSKELKSSVRAARTSKQLKQHVVTSFMTGPQPASILNYVVAYDGPAHIGTVHGWLGPIHAELGISVSALPQDEQRWRQPAPSLDGIFVLGKGLLSYDNFPMGFITDEHRRQYPDHCWQLLESKSGSVLYLFLLLTAAISGVSASWLNAGPYLSNFQFQRVGFVPWLCEPERTP